MSRRRVTLLVSAACVVLAACGGATATTTAADSTLPVTTGSVTTSPVATASPTTGAVTTTPLESECPEVLAVEMQETSPGVFTINTTVRSVDIEGVSYADAWEVRDLGGTVLGTRILTHPHANEQPFTRSLSGVAIPSDVTSVEVEARDSERGFCGVALTVAVPHA